jgi:3-phosphoshikimate 1-carboxyvinyltransferase
MVPRLIDELPLVALAACLAEGETVIRDAAELRVKESDRIRTTAGGLRGLGGRISEEPDGMRIVGSHRLRGASVSSYRDHRLAVMLGIAGSLAEGETEVRNSSAVGVSYPRFWEDLGRVTTGRE